MAIKDRIKDAFRSLTSGTNGMVPLEKVIYPYSNKRYRTGSREGSFGDPATDALYKTVSKIGGYGILQLHAIREIVKTSPFLQAYLKQGQQSIVGPNGPVPTFSSVTNSTDKRRISECFSEIKDDFGVTGNESFATVLKSLTSGFLVDGRALGIVKVGSSYNMGFAVQMLPREWLGNSFIHGGPTTKLINGVEYRCRHGVLYNKEGRIVAYEVYKDSPAMVNTLYLGNVTTYGPRGGETVTVSADNVLDHTIVAAPWNPDYIPEDIISIITGLGQIRHIDDDMVRLIRTFVNRMGMGVFIKNPATPGFGSDSYEDYMKTLTEGENDRKKFVDEYPEEIGPSITALPMGEDFKTPNSPSPNLNQERYRREMLKNYCAAAGVDYASMTGDNERVNYSSARHAALHARDTWRNHQGRMRETVLIKVMARYLEHCVARGYLRLVNPLSLKQAMHSPWTFKGFAGFDPYKDTIAIKTMMSMGLTSPQQEAMALGKDFLDILDEIAEAKRLMEEKGVTPADNAALSGSVTMSKTKEEMDIEDEDKDKDYEKDEEGDDE